MLLAIDIGNTSISLAVLDDKKVLLSFSFVKEESLKKISKVLRGLSKEYLSIEEAIICSVVPQFTEKIKTKIKKYLKIKVSIIGKDIKVPIKNKYENPKQVGQDRLVCAYAAKILYGKPLIIIDFGTAITFDVISKSGVYEGGIIVPGIKLSAEALFNKTALLPYIENIRFPCNLIGKNTEESILSGLFYGYGSICDGLIKKLSLRLDSRAKVIATGGYARLINKVMSKKIHKIDETLVLKGIALLGS